MAHKVILVNLEKTVNKKQRSKNDHILDNFDILQLEDILKTNVFTIFKYWSQAIICT